jgi:outer membrane protein
MEATLKKKVEELRVQAGALSRDAQQDRQTEIVRLQRDYEDAARALARKLEAEGNRIQEEILGLIVEATKTYAEKNNIDIVIETTMTVMYASPSTNISKPLLQEVNTLWKQKGSK